MADGMSIGGITIPISVVDASKGNIAKIKKELAGLTQATTKTGKATQKAGLTTKSFTKSTDKLTGSTIKAIKTTKNWGKATEQNVKQMRAAGASGKLMGKGMGNIITSTNESQKSMKGFAGALLGMNAKLTNFRWALVNIGFVAGTIALIATPFIKATKQAMAFEQELKKIQSVTNTMPDVSSKIILSARAGRPFDRNEVAQGFLEFSKAGFSAEEATKSLLPILNLAQAGMMDVSRAASLTAQVMHQFSTEGVTAIEVADKLSEVADLTRASEEGLGGALSYVGTIASQMNQSMSSTVQMLGILTNKGLNTTKAGTALRQVFSSLMDPSAKAEKALNKLGVSMVDAEGNIKPLSTFLRQLKISLDDMTAGARQNILGDMFEIRALAGVEAFMSELDDSITSLDEFSIRADNAGYSMVKAMVQSTSALNVYKSAWEDFKDGFIDVGNVTSDVVTSNIEGIKALGTAVGWLFKGVTEVLALIGRLLTPKSYDIRINIMGMPQISLAKPLWTMFGAKDESEFDRTINTIRDQLATLSTRGGFESMDVGSDILVGFEFIENFPSVLKTNFGKAGEEVKKFYDEFKASQEKTSKIAQEMQTVRGRIVDGDNSNANLKYIEEDKRLTAELTAEYEKQIEIKAKLGRTAIGAGITREFIDNVVIAGDVLTNFVEKIDLLKAGVERTGGVTSVLDGLLGLDKLYETSDKLQTLFEDTFEGIRTTAEKALSKGSIGQSLFDSVFGDIGEMESYIAKILEAEDKIAVFIEEQNDLKINIRHTTADLKKQKDALSDLKDELSAVNAKIAELSKPRFAGQLDVEVLIQNVDREIKKRKLADVGIADSYTFLQQALQSAKGGYDDLFNSIERVTGATTNSQTSYEAWQQTVQEFIRDTVKSGNILGMNVSGAVNKFSTLLLSTSKFNTETDKTSNTLSYLKDAYDIYYGGMTDDVANAVQAHKEEATGVFNSSGEVISALGEQWTKQTKLTAAVEAQQDVVDGLQDTLDGYKDRLQVVTDLIADQTDLILEQVKAYKELALAISKVVTPTPDSSATTNDENSGIDFEALNQQRLESQLLSGRLSGGGAIDMFENGLPQGTLGPNPYDASQSGQGALGRFESGLPQGTTPTATPTNSNSLGSKLISFGNIIVTGVLGNDMNGNDIAATIARTIKNELKTK